MLPAEMLDEGQADFFVRELVQKLVSGLGGRSRESRLVYVQIYSHSDSVELTPYPYSPYNPFVVRCAFVL